MLYIKSNANVTNIVMPVIPMMVYGSNDLGGEPQSYCGHRYCICNMHYAIESLTTTKDMVAK